MDEMKRLGRPGSYRLGDLRACGAEPVPPRNPDTCACCGRILPPGGRVLARRPVRPVAVIVIGVLAEDQPQVPFAGDQHPVQALAAGAGDPAFGYSVRARRLDRSLHDPHAHRREHRIEPGGELRIPVPDQELQVVSAALQVHQEIAGLLGHPRAGRVGGDAGQVHAPGAVLDEQHVQAAQQHGIDVEEVRGEDRRGLPGQERPPGLRGSSAPDAFSVATIASATVLAIPAPSVIVADRFGSEPLTPEQADKRTA